MAMSHDALELGQIRQHDDGEVDTEEGDLSSGPSARVRRTLLAISKALEVEEFQKSDEEIFNLTELLRSIYASASPQDSQEALEEVHLFVSSPLSHQMTVDTIAMVASRTVVKFADVSDRSKEIAKSIIKCFISACSPRDMISAFCEVLSALNLYRFILLTEVRGKTNHNGALSKNNLQRGFAEWLLPLRSVVSGIEAELKNAVLLVLYRCIELVEDIQKNSVQVCVRSIVALS